MLIRPLTCLCRQKRAQCFSKWPSTLLRYCTHMPPRQPPPARGLGRSPSKTKSFFSRRRSDANDLPKPEPVRAATSLGHRTPRSVHFDTPEPSAAQSRHVSGSSTAQRTSNLGRSQSLKYIDNAVPPTPPAKDTPPDEPPIRNMVQLHAPNSGIARSEEAKA